MEKNNVQKIEVNIPGEGKFDLTYGQMTFKRESYYIHFSIVTSSITISFVIDARKFHTVIGRLVAEVLEATIWSKDKGDVPLSSEYEDW